ncbi:hypothetical protein ACHAWF_007797 [Thalassiosira exigua]
MGATRDARAQLCSRRIHTTINRRPSLRSVCPVDRSDARIRRVGIRSSLRVRVPTPPSSGGRSEVFPYVPANPTSWGPPPPGAEPPEGGAAAEGGAPASRFADLPYAPFGRSDRVGRCADFTTQSFARTGDATAGYFRNARTRRGEADANKNLEFQYKVDAEEAKEFQLVDSSKGTGPQHGGGPGGGPGGKRFAPQARRRANAARLRQINARRQDANDRGPGGGGGEEGGDLQPAPEDPVGGTRPIMARIGLSLFGCPIGCTNQLMRDFRCCQVWIFGESLILPWYKDLLPVHPFTHTLIIYSVLQLSTSFVIKKSISGGFGGGRFGGGRGGRFGGRGGRFGGRGQWRDRVDRQASVSVRPDWRRVEEIDLSKLSKGTSPHSALMDNSNPKSVEDLLWCGFLDQYNDQYDKVSTRTPAPLKRVETKEFYPVTTTDDPVIEKLAIEGKGTVFATDAILAHLMTCPRSVYPWDIVVQKLPTGALFFDKRDASQFDYLTVHETSNNPPALARDKSNEEELVNSPERLSLEATMINQNFTQQILRSAKHRQTFDHPNPFWDEEDNDGMEPASVAYRYRKFDLGDDIQLVARTELHGLAKSRKKADTAKIVANVSANKRKKKQVTNPLDVPEGDQYMTAYALNEYDPSYVANAPPARFGNTVNWRDKIDNQAGAVLASELKNNSFKLAKWTAQSLLAGASQMKIGFVSRVSPKNAYEHAVLATQTYRPADLAAQITLNQGTMWGHMRLFVKLLADEPEGKYVVMRDPNRAIVRLYQVPPGTFEDTDDEDEEDEEEDDSGSEEEGEGEAAEEGEGEAEAKAKGEEAKE